MSVSVLEVTSLHATPVVPLNGSVTLSTVSGDTIYYGQDQTVSSSNNTGSLTSGGGSVTLNVQGWVRSAGVSAMQMVSGSPSSAAVTGAPNTFTDLNTFAQAVTLNYTASPASAGLRINPVGNAIGITMQTDWGANTSGQTGYDSIDVLHKSSGDANFTWHKGGVAQANLITGTVAANNALVWQQYPGVAGATANTYTVTLAVAGLNTALSVGVSGTDLTVNVATDGAGAATSTAAQVAAAVNAANQVLVRAFNAADAGGISDGTGVVGAVAKTALTGGFTGTSHGNAGFRVGIPYWIDDDGVGNGTLPNYRSGQIGVTVDNRAYFAYAPSITVAHASRAPAVQISNAQVASGYTTPAQTSGVALAISDASAVASIHITRTQAPAASAVAAVLSSYGAVFSVRSTAGSATFPVLIAAPQTVTNAPLGLWINNDGKASFGRKGAPDAGVVLVENTGVGTAAVTLQLSNTDATSGAGARIAFYAGTNQHATITSQYTPSGRSTLYFSGGNSGTLTEYLAVNNAGFACAMFNTGSSSSDGILLLKSTGTGSQGVIMRVQTGSSPATVWDIDPSANISITGAGGLKIGTTTAQKLAFFNSAPVAQQATTGTATGFTAGAGTAVTDQSTFTGASGSTAYRISDVVLALKNLGLLAA